MSVTNFDDLHMKMAGRIRELEDLLRQSSHYLKTSVEGPESNDWFGSPPFSAIKAYKPTPFLNKHGALINLASALLVHIRPSIYSQSRKRSQNFDSLCSCELVPYHAHQAESSNEVL